MMKNKYSFIALIIFLFVGPFLFPNATIAEMLIFGIVAISTNIMLGYTGMLSFGQALFFGTSAYISGLMLLGGFPLFLAIPVATLGLAAVMYFLGKATSKSSMLTQNRLRNKLLSLYAKSWSSSYFTLFINADEPDNSRFFDPFTVTKLDVLYHRHVCIFAVVVGL